MSDRPVKRRSYDSTKRTAAALERRRRIRASASDLFADNGFTATTMAAVAKAAGVSERSVYLAFPTKAALLNECIRVAVRGDDEEITLHAREAWQAAFNAPADEMLARFADAGALLMSRAARLLAVGESADLADPAVGEFRERGRAATRIDALEAAKALERAGVLRADLSSEEAADIIYAIASSESVYLRLVEQRGRSTSTYARVIERALTGALASPGVSRRNAGRR
jgi:AcrR family transcriptional regulator